MGRGPPRPLLPGGRIQRSPDLHQAQDGPRRSGQDPSHHGQCPLLPRHSAGVLRRDREATGEAGLVQREPAGLAPGGHREALRTRSGLGAPAQYRAGPGARGEPDLPHRSLPRQGDGAEHHGVSLRQRALRARVEPALRRPRADHGGGDGGRGRPGQLLRQGRAWCATWCRITCSSSWPSWPWSRPPPSRPMPCATSGSRCSRPSAPGSRRTCWGGRCGDSTDRARWADRSRPAIAASPR